eukprot:7384194-Alexandrium_andersonii.AAC.1
MWGPALRRLRTVRAPRAPVAEETHVHGFFLFGPDRGVPSPGVARTAVLRRVVEGVDGLPDNYASPEAAQPGATRPLRRAHP